MACREVGGVIKGPQEASWGGNKESTDLSVLFLTSPCSSAVISITVSVYKEHSRREDPFGLWPIPSRTEQSQCWMACQRPCSLCARKPHPHSVTVAEYVSSSPTTPPETTSLSLEPGQACDLYDKSNMLVILRDIRTRL